MLEELFAKKAGKTVEFKENSQSLQKIQLLRLQIPQAAPLF